MSDILVIIGLLIAIVGMFEVIPIFVLISVLFIIPKLIWIIATIEKSVYNDDEDDIYEE